MTSWDGKYRIGRVILRQSCTMLAMQQKLAAGQSAGVESESRGLTDRSDADDDRRHSHRKHLMAPVKIRQTHRSRLSEASCGIIEACRRNGAGREQAETSFTDLPALHGSNEPCADEEPGSNLTRKQHNKKTWISNADAARLFIYK